MHVLALNSGSSSLKFGLYAAQSAGLDVVVVGEADAIGSERAAFHAEDADGHTLLRETAPMATHRDAVVRLAGLLAEHHAPVPDAIGHRIVHGGPQAGAHDVIDASVLQRLESAVAFAPLHTPAALSVIRVAAEHFPGRPQVACYDTGFHARMPALASTLPLPRELRDAGLRRYGFHGLSCESIVQQLAGALPARLVIAHLGNGASVTAARDGVSIDTSMGLTPTGGLIMGTRSGDLDPGLLVYLMRELGFDAVALEALVDQRSGLLGLSGVASDMRALHDAAPSNADAQLAIRMFCYRAAKEMAAMGAALGGVDGIVFTGGIGENDARVRAEICTGLAVLGVALDDDLNARGRGLISHGTSRCTVQVLPSLEDEQIARHAAAWCSQTRPAPSTPHSTPKDPAP